jgi:hypothetical protein
LSFEEHERWFIWFCGEPNCDRYAAFRPHDFFECVEELKARGWGFMPPTRGEYGDDWEHRCPKHRKRLADIVKGTFKQAGVG